MLATARRERASTPAPVRDGGTAADDSAGAAAGGDFPRAARLLKTDEFSSVFRLRPWRRSEHFVLYMLPTGKIGRMGLVAGKKFAPRAATRNMIRRHTREIFRMRRASLHGWDLLLRMHRRFDKTLFPGAAPPSLGRLCRAEIAALFDQAVQRGAPALPPAGAIVPPEH